MYFQCLSVSVAKLLCKARAYEKNIAKNLCNTECAEITKEKFQCFRVSVANLLCGAQLEEKDLLALL